MKISDVVEIWQIRSNINQSFIYDSHFIFLRDEKGIRWLNLDWNVEGYAADIDEAKAALNSAIKKAFFDTAGDDHPSVWAPVLAARFSSGCPEQWWRFYRGAAFLANVVRGLSETESGVIGD